MNFNELDAILREILQEHDSPIKLEDGRLWVVTGRDRLLHEVSERIFDKHLELIKKVSVEVLREINPIFDLPAGDRWSAAIEGKELRHSESLRQGIAETLVWFGMNGNVLLNCSPQARTYVSLIAIRDILFNADWQLWGSLNEQLPTLAEAAPVEFLNSVAHALQLTPCPFDELFAQEGDGISGRNYMTGLLWALEGLAWHEEHFVRVAVVLAELASHDPGGNWANRPSNSLSTILLPWYPQTLAPINKRIAAIQAIKADFPEIAWSLLLALLPNHHQISSGTHKPRWRIAVPDEWKPSVTDAEYWEQIEEYAAIAVEMARTDSNKLKALINDLDNLPKLSFNTLLEYLSSGAVLSLTEHERYPIWTSLSDFVRKHRRYADAQWALGAEIVSTLDEIANKLAPTKPEIIFRSLFSNRDFDLYEGNGNWEEQRKVLDQKRQQAIQQIINENGLEGVLSFIATVKSPYQVGYALGQLTNAEVESRLLPDYLLTSDEHAKQLASGFIWGRFYSQGWPWVDGISRVKWSIPQQCQLLLNLPFIDETWGRVSNWLKDSDDQYWKMVQVNPYQTNDDILLPVIDKLLYAGRPQSAIDCLHYRIYAKHPFDSKRTVQALMAAVIIQEPNHQLDSYHITELINALQNDPSTDHEELFRVEWAYIQLLKFQRDVSPKLIEKRLATKPEFFCEIIQLIYRSKLDDEKIAPPDEEKKTIAANAWHLLHEWRHPPGMQDNGSFSSAEFESWLSAVKQISSEIGHFEVAMLKVGEVLFYCPPDPDGLWINRSVASALNARDAEEIRNGFRTEVFNSRGAHWVDPTGKPEMELAQQWQQKAETVENAGFARFAAILRELAGSYERDAERIIRTHKQDNEK